MPTSKQFSISKGAVSVLKNISSLRCVLGSVAVAMCAVVLVAGQERSDDMGGVRGNRAELSITIKEGSSQLVGQQVTIKLLYMGTVSQQMTTTKGRAVFILNNLGDYTITADAIGYRSAQKDISVPIPVAAEEQITLQRDLKGEALGADARPLLAPKAKESIDKALEALKANKLADAEKSLDEAAKLAPNHPDVLYLQGVVSLQRGEPEKARSFLEKAAQVDPKNARVLSALGMALVNESRFDLAIAPLQHSLDIDPERWDTHYALAKAFYNQQQFDGALHEAQQALGKSHGSEPAIELLIAQAQTAVGKFEDSANTLRTFLRLHPDDKGAATARRWLDRLIADGKIRKWSWACLNRSLCRKVISRLPSRLASLTSPATLYSKI
jgi:tetratricopeptide (TPR) repeat protein